MKKASEYRQHAQECRALAKGMEQGEHREQLLRMAETWEGLAEQRERQHDDAPSGGAGDPARGPKKSPALT
jgi:hypothetical protein